MIKKTLHFGNPAYLSMRNRQLCISLPEVEQADVPPRFKEQSVVTVPIEDIGVVVLCHRRITITHSLIEALLANNVALVSCAANGMPEGLMLPLAGHTTHTEQFRCQVEATLPLKKQLWQQTVRAKIVNQSVVLAAARGADIKPLQYMAEQVKSGDPDNHEGHAAAYYWSHLFGAIEGFRRDRDGIPPNNLLNYGYAILRAVMARAIVSAGLMPSLGIFHRNKYNAYCLADDLMEPYRPVVDRLVVSLADSGGDMATLDNTLKQELLALPTLDVLINRRRRPLMLAATDTAASLCKCFSGEARKILFPEIII